jgi:hypothetical protein
MLFAYASSVGSVPDGTAGTVSQVVPSPEKPVAAEKVADEPAYAETSVYVNSTVGVQDQIRGYAELEKPAYAGVNSTDDSKDQASIAPDEQKNEQQNAEDGDQGSNGETGEQESQDTIQKRVLDMLDKIVDVDDDKHKDGKGQKGKG